MDNLSSGNTEPNIDIETKRPHAWSAHTILYYFTRYAVINTAILPKVSAKTCKNNACTFLFLFSFNSPIYFV